MTAKKDNILPSKLGLKAQIPILILGFLLAFDYYWQENTWQEGLLKSIIDVAMLMGILHLNYRVLIPRFLQKKHYFSYTIAALACALGYIVFQRYSGLEMYLCGEISWQGVSTTLLDWVLYLYLTTLFWYFSQLQTERERQSLLHSEKLEMELKFLRTQINPHFIFNSLNNIYSLALSGHPNAALMVARLADILRYGLYENNATTLLVQELEVVKKFIELQRLRNLPSQNIDFYLEGNPDGFEIAPMLLLNFIENCFKHSRLDQDEEAWVRITVEISPDGNFEFKTANSLFDAAKNLAGIGLQNAQRLLELNYPNQHLFSTRTEKDVFHLFLQIQLKKWKK